jgi:hypothetical protein
LAITCPDLSGRNNNGSAVGNTDMCGEINGMPRNTCKAGKALHFCKAFDYLSIIFFIIGTPFNITVLQKTPFNISINIIFHCSKFLIKKPKGNLIKNPTIFSRNVGSAPKLKLRKGIAITLITI